MKAFLITAMLLVLTGCSARARTCSRMKELCGAEPEECSAVREKVRESFGDESLKSFDACFTDAKSCSEAYGCGAGVGLKGLGEETKNFLEGLNKSLAK